jgi:hypothetical protein
MATTSELQTHSAPTVETLNTPQQAWLTARLRLMTDLGGPAALLGLFQSAFPDATSQERQSVAALMETQ